MLIYYTATCIFSFTAIIANASVPRNTATSGTPRNLKSPRMVSYPDALSVMVGLPSAIESVPVPFLALDDTLQPQSIPYGLTPDMKLGQQTR